EEVPLLIAKNVAFFVDHLRLMTLSDGTPYVVWDYQLVEHGVEDVPHGNFSLDCLAVILEDQVRLDALLARAGRPERIPLGPALGARFANTFLRKIWRKGTDWPHGALNEKVNGTNEHEDKWPNSSVAPGFIPLAQFDPWVWKRSADMFNNTEQ